jgi:hypothetical protein
MAHRSWRLDAPVGAARSFSIQRFHAANHLSYLGLVFRRLRKIHAIGSGKHVLQIVSKQIKCRKCCGCRLEFYSGKLLYLHRSREIGETKPPEHDGIKLYAIALCH